MIILVVNAGSSSLKYQLINMEDESVIAKGNCDRIGIDGHLSHKTASGVKVEKDCDFPTHAEAFSCLVEALTTGEGAVISSMDEISAVGHRVVQGAEVFTKTTLVTDEIIEKIDELRELAPYITTVTHWHCGLAARSCRTCRRSLYSTPHSTRPFRRRHSCTVSRMRTMSSSMSASTASTAHPTVLLLQSWLRSWAEI